MGRRARSLVARVEAGVPDRDVTWRRAARAQVDDEIDACNREVFRIAVEIGDEPDAREWAMTMMLVARAIERIGDNAVDIGEQTAFVVSGCYREFEDASHDTA